MEHKVVLALGLALGLGIPVIAILLWVCLRRSANARSVNELEAGLAHSSERFRYPSTQKKSTWIGGKSTPSWRTSELSHSSGIQPAAHAAAAAKPLEEEQKKPLESPQPPPRQTTRDGTSHLGFSAPLGAVQADDEWRRRVEGVGGSLKRAATRKVRLAQGMVAEHMHASIPERSTGHLPSKTETDHPTIVYDATAPAPAPYSGPGVDIAHYPTASPSTPPTGYDYSLDLRQVQSDRKQKKRIIAPDAEDDRPRMRHSRTVQKESIDSVPPQIQSELYDQESSITDSSPLQRSAETEAIFQMAGTYEEDEDEDEEADKGERDQPAAVAHSARRWDTQLFGASMAPVEESAPLPIESRREHISAIVAGRYGRPAQSRVGGRVPSPPRSALLSTLQSSIRLAQQRATSSHPPELSIPPPPPQPSHSYSRSGPPIPSAPLSRSIPQPHAQVLPPERHAYGPAPLPQTAPGPAFVNPWDVEHSANPYIYRNVQLPSRVEEPSEISPVSPDQTQMDWRTEGTPASLDESEFLNIRTPPDDQDLNMSPPEIFSNSTELSDPSHNPAQSSHLTQSFAHAQTPDYEQPNEPTQMPTPPDSNSSPLSQDQSSPRSLDESSPRSIDSALLQCTECGESFERTYQLK